MCRLLLFRSKAAWLLVAALVGCSSDPVPGTVVAEAGPDAALTFDSGSTNSDAATADAPASSDLARASDVADAAGEDAFLPNDVAVVDDLAHPDASETPDVGDAATVDAVADAPGPDTATPDVPDSQEPETAPPTDQADVADTPAADTPPDGGAPDVMTPDMMDIAVKDAAPEVAGPDAAEVDGGPPQDAAGPAQCLENAACDDGNACTVDTCVAEVCKHAVAAEGTACGGATVATQFQCMGAELMKRTGVAGCNGAPGSCSTAVPAWSAWQKVKSCVSSKGCQVAADGSSGTCVAGCTPNTQCCTADGSLAPKQTKCGSFAWDSEEKCSGLEKSGQVLARTSYTGCTGTTTFCSSQSADLAWTPWIAKKTCKATEVCEMSFGYGSCVSAFKCTPGSKCCTSEGAYAAKGTQCSTFVADYEYQCSGTGKGNAVHERKGYDGCSGSSTYCSFSSADIFWGPWLAYKQCKATEKCEVSSSGSYGSCVSAVVCTPGSTCCTADGEYAAKGGKCGSFASKTEQKCSGTGKGADVLQRQAFASCSGTSTSCSYASADYWWSAWAVATTCTASQYCKQSTVSYAYCTTTAP